MAWVWPGAFASCLQSDRRGLDFYGECSGFRFGEARHPGPCEVTIGTSNPSGLRNKEGIVADWGPGVWALSETQLSQVTQPSSRKALVSLGHQQCRHVRVHIGAPAPLRTSSEWAGSWSGVLQSTDFPSQPIRLSWPLGAFETGRVQVVMHSIAQVPVCVANVYGYSPGPTWPRALAMTDDLLVTLTKDLVLGKQGLRIIAGDFNHSSSSLSQTDLWRQAGWVECQEYAAQHWGQDIQPTCKGATVRDFLWLSPEAAALLKRVTVTDDFQASAQRGFVPSLIPHKKKKKRETEG